MPFKFSKRSADNLAGVHADMRNLAYKALALTMVDFVVIEGLRTPERQRQLYLAGASQKLTGGRHTTGHAIDVAAWAAGSLRWDAVLYYSIAAAFQTASKALGTPIRWGGAWTRLDTTNTHPANLAARYSAISWASGRKPFLDLGHFELPSTNYP